MDKNSLVEVGTKIVNGLQAETIGLNLAAWVRQDLDDSWLLWLGPKSFQGRTNFYNTLASVLTRLRSQTGYFEISNVRVIEPTHSVLAEFRRFGRVSPQLPRYLFSQNLGGVYVKEAILLLVD